MTPSTNLLKYLRSYQKWVEAGATGDEFSRCPGLCNQTPTSELYYDLQNLLEYDFSTNSTFPFGGERYHLHLSANWEQHLNQARLDWIKEKLAIPQGLRWFLSEWLGWAEAGGGGGPFKRNLGLCTNVERFAEHNGLEYKVEEIIFKQLMDRLTIDFDDTMFPFGFKQYEAGRVNFKQHQDPVRLAWVKEKLS